MAYTRKTKLALVPKKVIPQFEAVSKLLVDLPVLQRHPVIAETRAFFVARSEAQFGYLAMGEHLKALRDVLEPAKKWKEFVGLLPNVSQATAYRMIWAFENVGRVLPPATARAATRLGYRIVDWRKDGAFAPGYGEAVKRVNRELGPAPATDEAAAEQWLRAVLVAKKEMSKKPAVTLVTIESRERSVVATIRRVIALLDESDRSEFGVRLAGIVLAACGARAQRVTPVELPETVAA